MSFSSLPVSGGYGVQLHAVPYGTESPRATTAQSPTCVGVAVAVAEKDVVGIALAVADGLAVDPVCAYEQAVSARPMRPLEPVMMTRVISKFR